MDYTIKVDAWDAIIDMYRAAETAPDIVGAVTERNARKLLGLVQQLSPYRTGEYRASHRIELRKNGMAFQAEIGSDLDRGKLLEFGGTVNMPNGGTSVRPPKPHFRPAFETVSNEYYGELFEFVRP